MTSDPTLSDDEARLQEFLLRPNVPADAKRRAVEAFRALQATTTTPTTTPTTSQRVAQGAWEAGAGPLRMALPSSYSSPPPGSPGWRQAAGLGGAAAGTLAGGLGTMSLPGAAAGGFTGYGLGTTAYDLAHGEYEPTARGLAQLGGQVALETLPATRGLRVGQGALETAKALTASGLGAGIGGQLYDAARSIAWGKRQTPRQVATQAAEDVAAGAGGRYLGETLANRLGSLSADRTARRAHMNEIRAQYERQKITPRASEILESPGMAQAENAAGVAPIGGGRVRQAEANRMEELRLRGEELVGGPDARLRTGDLTTAAQTGLEEGRAEIQALGRAFADLNEAIGDPPVVPMAPFRAALAEEVRVGRWTPGGVRHGAGRMRGMPTETATTITGVERRTVRPETAAGGPAPLAPYRSQQMSAGPRPPEVETRAVGFPMRQPMAGPGGEDVTGTWEMPSLDEVIYNAAAYEAIPWRLARTIQQELGERVGRGQTIPGMSQRRARKLYRGITEGIEQFLASPEGAQYGPEFTQLRTTFREAATRWKTSELQLLVNEQGGHPEQLLANVFAPGNITLATRFRNSVPQEYFDTVLQGWFHGKYEQCVDELPGGGRVFNADRFFRLMQPYDRHGQLDEWLGPERANDFRELLQVIRHTQAVGTIARRSSGTAERAASLAQIGGAATIATGLTGAALGFGATPGVAIPSAAATAGALFLAPAVMARITTSPGGIKALTAALGGPMTRARTREGLRLGTMFATEAPQREEAP